NYSAYSNLPYFQYTSIKKYTDRYYYGPQLLGASSPFYENGEGWMTDNFNAVPAGNLLTTTLPTAQVYTGGGSPPATFLAVSASNSNVDTAIIDHHLRIQAGTSSTLVFDTTFADYHIIKKSFTLPATDLGVTTPVTHLFINDLGLPSDVQVVSSAAVTYGRMPNLAGLSALDFTVDFNSLEAKSRYTLSNYGGGSPLVYVLGDSVWRITPSINGTDLSVLIPNNTSLKSNACHLASSVTNITTIKPVNGTGLFNDFASMAIDSAFIIITHPTLLSGAQQYANYRSSVAGGAHNAIVVSIDELYHQYAAGIIKHPLSIKRFCDDMYASWAIAPHNLLLIGKSIRMENEGLSQGSRQSTGNYNATLVPTISYPATDILFTSDLSALSITPNFPVGRLSVTSNVEIQNYLDKVIAYEQAQQDPVYTKASKDWMKHGLHFGGGSNSNEQTQFQFFLGQFQQTIEDTLFGADIDSFYKTTSQPIDPIDFQEVSDRVNQGISIMTFFGHASIGGFDQNIDEVQNWQNQDKYPFLLANACFTGDIHQPGNTSVSEEFTLIPDKGVIGYLSTVKLGFVGTLYEYSRRFYLQLSAFNYGSTVGNIMKATLDSLNGFPVLNNYYDIQYYEVYQGMTLHGDPAIKLNTHARPELIIETSDVFITPEDITLATDSFDVNLIITNLGRATNSNFVVELIRHFPNGNGDSTYSKIIDGIDYKDTVTFRIPTQHFQAFGENVFEVFVDLNPDAISEMYDEVNNNRITFTHYINANAILPVYPYDYAIYPDSIVTVKASTLNPLASSRLYRFEIDTTDAYNSPMHRYALVMAPGGVVGVDYNDWFSAISGLPLPLVHTDSTVYFWRVSPDSSTFIWQEHSYQYINGKEGWGQAHFFQFKNNTNQYLIYDKPGREWEFDAFNRIIRCDVFGDLSYANIGEIAATGWYINGDVQETNGWQLFPALVVGVIDPFSTASWYDYNSNPLAYPEHNFGSFDVRPWRPEKWFYFRQNTQVEMDSLVNMLATKIPCGFYYVVYSYNYADYSEWDAHNTNLYPAFQALGFDSIYQGRPEAPFILTGRMCDPNSVSFTIGANYTSDITHTDTLLGILPGGYTSTKIGPAYQWNTLYWKQHALEVITGDTSRITVIGISNAGTETVLLDTLLTQYDSILNLNTIVNAAQYPYMRLNTRLIDNVTQTPAWMERWQILYTPAPEAALNPTDGFYVSHTDTIQEGDSLKFAMAIRNISPYDMDSLLVHYWLEDEDRVRYYHNSSYAHRDSLLSGTFMLDTVTINTTGAPGNSVIWIEANPVPIGAVLQNYDQLEQYHFNNIAQYKIHINGDDENPILDVTFDGVHILNGDIVSAKPFISVVLDDENPFLIMNLPEDTTRFIVHIVDPVGIQKRIYFNQGVIEVMKFIPAGNDNKCKIEYTGNFPVDGKYKLLIKAWDKSDNRSGDIEYALEFEVINQMTITEIMNWPNPFTTSTRFVFTLTGSEVPDYMKIQIFTVTGKVIREITVDELGPIHVGRNITEYAWNGTDEFGDRLANGVYFYRVITRDNDAEVEKRASGADSYFNKGFGKMYLMR
ncbi:MAG: C25 family cysteine peptidase, partial [Flavobacteriales bacterium]